jgi:hypothetical protein
MQPNATVGGAMREPGEVVKTKRKCCKSRRRCKRCPVVWKRLSNLGFAERESKRRYVVIDVVPKRTMKSARG